MIHANKHPFAGFFGCIGEHGAVCNLNIDCQILGNGNAAGALCALNEGEIVNCTASSACDMSRFTGGLAARNSGHNQPLYGAWTDRQRGSHTLVADGGVLLLLCFPFPSIFP